MPSLMFLRGILSTLKFNVNVKPCLSTLATHSFKLLNNIAEQTLAGVDPGFLEWVQRVFVQYLFFCLKFPHKNKIIWSQTPVP